MILKRGTYIRDAIKVGSTSKSVFAAGSKDIVLVLQLAKQTTGCINANRGSTNDGVT